MTVTGWKRMDLFEFTHCSNDDFLSISVQWTRLISPSSSWTVSLIEWKYRVIGLAQKDTKRSTHVDWSEAFCPMAISLMIEHWMCLGSGAVFVFVIWRHRRYINAAQKSNRSADKKKKHQKTAFHIRDSLITTKRNRQTSQIISRATRGSIHR